MGVAETIPGVSGATIAWLFERYHRFVVALSRIPSAAMMAMRGRIVDAFHHVDGVFMLTLGISMVVALGVSSVIISRLLSSFPFETYACLTGIILGALVNLIRWQDRSIGVIIALVSGLSVGLAISVIPEVSLPTTTMGLLFGGALAGASWILPGVSGSYVLALLGLYEPVITAVASADIWPLIPLACGVIGGSGVVIATFARSLSQFATPVSWAMVGLVAGSVRALLPESESTEASVAGSVLALLGFVVAGGIRLWATAPKGVSGHSGGQNSGT